MELIIYNQVREGSRVHFHMICKTIVNPPSHTRNFFLHPDIYDKKVGDPHHPCLKIV